MIFPFFCSVPSFPNGNLDSGEPDNGDPVQWKGTFGTQSALPGTSWEHPGRTQKHRWSEKILSFHSRPLSLYRHHHEISFSSHVKRGTIPDGRKTVWIVAIETLTHSSSSARHGKPLLLRGVSSGDAQPHSEDSSGGIKCARHREYPEPWCHGGENVCLVSPLPTLRFLRHFLSPLPWSSCPCCSHEGMWHTG